MENKKIVRKEETYKFHHPWPIVVKAFWIKYPNPKFQYVKFNKVIDMEVIDSDIIRVKRIMFSKIKDIFLQLYSLEDIVINFKESTLEMETLMLKKSMFVPLGKEICRYISINENGNNYTLYTKIIESTNKIKLFLDYFSNNFVKGCQVVEENIIKLENQA